MQRKNSCLWKVCFTRTNNSELILSILRWKFWCQKHFVLDSLLWKMSIKSSKILKKNRHVSNYS